MTRTAILTAVIFIVVGCYKVELPPERPANVPESAVWGGGVDGGHWFNCQPRNEQNVYDCQIFSDLDGTMTVEGTYVLREVNWIAEERRAEYSLVTISPEFAFDFFDGHLIHLDGKFALVPDGIIYYPFGDGHGKRRAYKEGVPTGPEEEY